MNQKVNLGRVFFSNNYISLSYIIYFTIDEILGDNMEDVKYDSEEEKIWKNMEEVKSKKRKTKHL
jgi:hypothetical protein